MANPIGNVLVGNRHRGFTMPIGRMSLNEKLKPIGRMSFKDSRTFAGFTSSLPAKNAGSTFWAGFASSLPAEGTTYSGKGWA
jgi:hypothetical protein